jgi:hypothetical protein
LETWADGFISRRCPKRNPSRIRRIDGMIHADALFGSPDIIAIVSGSDIQGKHSMIDRIAELEEIERTSPKVARWLDGIGTP